jgi:isopropylmalate/homocitrate/citramalate synthase
MKDQETVLSIIVNAIQFALQHSQETSGQPSDIISSEEQVFIARAVLAAISEQGFQVTRVPSEPR